MSNELQLNEIKPICGWDDCKTIFFVYRDKTRQKKVYEVKDFRWYFCISLEDYQKTTSSNQRLFEEVVQKSMTKWEIKRDENNEIVLDNLGNKIFLKKHLQNPIKKVVKDEDFVRIFCDKNTDETKSLLKNLEKASIETKEADLSLIKRYMIDNLIEIEENLSILFFDIETNDSNQGIVIGRDEILSWAACDNEGEMFYEKSEDVELGEYDLLIKILKLFQKYDLIVGWNSNQFDIAYIKARIDKLNISGNSFDEIDINLNQTNYWKKFIHVDLMQRLIKLFGPMMTVVNLTGFSLNEVAKVFVGEQKIERSEKVIELFNKNHKKLEEYNKKDVLLLKQINDKLRTIPLMIKECAWTGTFMDRFYIGELLDNYILREASFKKYHLKSRPRWNENDEAIRVRGGYVMEPQTGLYDNVRTLDFKCFVRGTKVFTDSGYKNIEDITTIDKVQDIDNVFSKIKTFSKQKYRGKLKKITTTNGYSVECTSNHRWPIFEKGNIILKETKDLTTEDSLLSPVKYEFKENNNQNDLYELIGIFYFESVCKKIRHQTKKNYISDDYRVQLSLLNNEIEFKDRISKLLKKYAPFDFEWKEKKNSIFLKMGNKLHNNKRNTKEVYIWLQENFKKLETADFLNSSYNLKVFCKAAFEADGTINIARNTVVINSGTKYKIDRKNRIFLLHHLLKRIGINSNIGKHKNIVILEIYRIEDLKEFQKEINFISDIKCNKLIKSISNRKEKTKELILNKFIKRKILKIEEVEYDGYIYNLGLENQTKPFYIANDLLTKNSMYPSIIVGWNIGQESLVRGLISTVSQENFKKWLGDKKIEEVPFLEWYEFLKKENKTYNPKNEYYQTANNQFFKKEKPSIIAGLIKKLLQERKEYKKQQIEAEYKSIEYNNAQASQEAIKEMSNCLHEDTLLNVYDSKKDSYSLVKMKDLYLDQENKYIESYNFKEKKNEWKRISKVFRKEYDGIMKKLSFYHSNSIFCTPEHRLYGFEYENYSYKNSNNKIVYKQNHDDVNFLDKLEQKEIKEIKAADYKENTITIAKANSTFTEKNIDYIDIRDYEMKSIFNSKKPKMQLYYKQKRYRNKSFISTNCKEFDEYILSNSYQMLKSKKNAKNEYRLIVPLTKELWDLVKTLNITSIEEYGMSVKLWKTGFEFPILLKISKELMWFLGLWLAEGCSSWKIDKQNNVIGGLVITSSVKEYLRKCFDFLNKYKFRYKNRTEKVFKEFGGDCLRINNSIFAEIICKDFYNSEKHNAYSKKIPSWIFRLNKELIKEFLDAYSCGDGSLKENSDRITTVSEHLSLQIPELLRYIYNRPVRISIETTKEGKIGYRIIYRRNKHKTIIFERYNNDITYEELKKITDISFKGFVYDIEVEDNHNFFIGNILGKNSMFGITADKQARFFDPRIAEAITMTGQFTNRTTMAILEKMGYRVIYGDSVIGSTIVNFNRKNIKIEDLWKKYESFSEKDNDKEIINFSKVKHDTEVSSLGAYTEKRTKTSKLIRHWTKKKLYEIETESGKKVTITGDHSLIVNRNNKKIVIKSEELNKDTDKFYCKIYNKTSTSVELEKIDKITEIKNLGQFVYDFEVPHTQSFRANDIFVHNTDSIFTIVKDDEEILKIIKELNEKLSKHLSKTYMFTDNIILVEYEKKFRKFIMLDKKRYTGHLIEIDGKKVDSILSKGTENVRKSTIDFTKRKVNECIDLIVKQDKDLKYMKKWVQDLKKYVMNENMTGKDLAITMKLSKPISSYKSKPPHVILAEKLIKTNEILETSEGKHVWGQKIEYIIRDNKTKEDKVILLRDFKGEWDRKYYWDVQIYAPLMRILKTVWPDSNWEEHNILIFEKLQKKVELEERKKIKEKEKQEKKEEREMKKKTKKQLELI